MDEKNIIVGIIIMLLIGGGIYQYNKTGKVMPFSVGDGTGYEPEYPNPTDSIFAPSYGRVACESTGVRFVSSGEQGFPGEEYVIWEKQSFWGDYTGSYKFDNERNQVYTWSRKNRNNKLE